MPSPGHRRIPKGIPINLVTNLTVTGLPLAVTLAVICCHTHLRRYPNICIVYMYTVIYRSTSVTLTYAVTLTLTPVQPPLSPVPGPEFDLPLPLISVSHANPNPTFLALTLLLTVNRTQP